MASNPSDRTQWLGRGERGSPARFVAFRVQTRREVRTSALITHVQAGWQRQVELENIGLGGARVLVDEELTPGEFVTMSLAASPLAASEFYAIFRARVAWVALEVAASDPVGSEIRRRVGVAFEHTSADAVFALYGFIAPLAGE